MMPIDADHSLSNPESAAIRSIGSISGETHRESRCFEDGQRLFGLTLEMVESFYLLLLLNQVITGRQRVDKKLNPATAVPKVQTFFLCLYFFSFKGRNFQHPCLTNMVGFLCRYYSSLASASHHSSMSKFS
jgi:hypothetical protein